MTSAIPMLQPGEFKSLNTASDDTALELVTLRLHVDDLSAIIANQNERIDQLSAEKATVYEQARADADARLELLPHILAELWRNGEEIDTQTKDGDEVTLDALFDVDMLQWLDQTAWAAKQILRSPECVVTTWLRKIDHCLHCARNGHRCDAAPCGYHHDDIDSCEDCKHAMQMDAADRAREEEREC